MCVYVRTCVSVCVCVCTYVCVSLCVCVHVYTYFLFLLSIGMVLLNICGRCDMSQNSYFSSHLGNFINVCHTLATRHEQLQCYLRCDDSVFGIDTEVGPGKCNHC